MPFTVILPRAAQKALDKIPRTSRGRILDALEELSDDPRPAGCVKQEGEDNLWRIRVGDYRVV